MTPNFSLKTVLNIKPEQTKGETLLIRAPDDYLAGVLRNIVDIFERQKYCDVTLIAEDGEFQVGAHRLILSAASQYFAGMFGSGLREATAKEVSIKVDGHSLKEVINYIYTASIELTADTVEDIIKAAQIFQLTSLENLCSDFIANQLDPSNCLGIALFAEHHDFKKLYGTAEAFVCENFMKLRSDEEFYSLSPDQLTKFISSDDLRVPSEEEVFHSVMSWVKHDKVKREQFIEKLLHHVRFPLLLPRFIASTVEQACQSIECERLIAKAYKWHLLPEFRLSLFAEEQTKLRNFKDMIIAISGWGNTERSLNVGFYYQGLNEWIYREWPGPPQKRSQFGSTTFDGKLIIAGGTLASSVGVTNRVDCFDLKTLKWSELAPLTTARRSCGMATLNGNVYVLGGENTAGAALSSVEKWDPLSKQWRYVTPMNEGNSNPCVAVRFNSLCVSKMQYNRNSCKHNIYDPSTDTWTDNWLNTNGPLLGMGTVSVLSTDYFIAVSRTSITRYNLAIQSSANIPTNAIKAECTHCTVVEDRIIVYGQNDFQEYHVFQNEWETLPRLTNNQGNVLLISN